VRMAAPPGDPSSPPADRRWPERRQRRPVDWAEVLRRLVPGALAAASWSALFDLALQVSLPAAVAFGAGSVIAGSGLGTWFCAGRKRLNSREPTAHTGPQPPAGPQLAEEQADDDVAWACANLTADDSGPRLGPGAGIPQRELMQKRLELYERIARSQARVSLFTAQAATGIGVALLLVFAVLAARAPSTASAVTAGSLAAVSAALSGYIGRAAVRSQQEAVVRLRAYFDEPLVFSRYLEAERNIAVLAEGMTEGERIAILNSAARECAKRAHRARRRQPRPPRRPR
jgi:hypothetical protein